MTSLQENIQIEDLTFVPFLTHFDLLERIKELGISINQDYEHKNPLFISVLNGSFMFTSDLMKQIDLRSELTFIKVNSYQGTETTNDIKEVIGLSHDISNRHVIIVEDIVDTGNTIDYVMQTLQSKNPKSLEIVTLFSKPKSYSKDYNLRYVGFEIPDKFIVGYGLDYDGYGRNYQDVYQLNS